MTDMFEAPVDYLANHDVRTRYEVAYWPGLDGDGWLVTAKGTVNDYPDTVQWHRPEAVSATPELVAVTVAGTRFEQFPGYPIVLREAVQ